MCMIKLQSTKRDKWTGRYLSVVSTCSKGITVGSGRNWGRSWCNTCCGLCSTLWNKFWSASKQMSLKLGKFLEQNLARVLQHKNPSTFWRSCIPAKPHHAGEAYKNLAYITERKTACMAVSHKPWARRSLRAYNVCALEAINCWICKVTDSPLVNVTPKILICWICVRPFNVSGVC